MILKHLELDQDRKIELDIGFLKTLREKSSISYTYSDFFELHKVSITFNENRFKRRLGYDTVKCSTMPDYSNKIINRLGLRDDDKKWQVKTFLNATIEEAFSIKATQLKIESLICELMDKPHNIKNKEAKELLFSFFEQKRYTAYQCIQFLELLSKNAKQTIEKTLLEVVFSIKFFPKEKPVTSSFDELPF